MMLHLNNVVARTGTNMALNWNIEKCDDYKELTTDTEWPVTNALIWATMAVRLGDITEKNAGEFYRRLHEIEEKNGTFLMEKGQPYYITLAEVKRRIGLRTNVGNTPKREFDAWLKSKTPAATEV